MLSPGVRDWLPENHLARFIAEIVAKLDMGVLRAQYAGRGREAYQPEMMAARLLYGHATGIFSSRKLDRATYDSVAFRFVTAANQHPEHDTICDFRRPFLPQVHTFFEQILLIAAGSGMLKIGRVSIEGTAVMANASKHHALSYGHATKLERRIKGETERSLRLTEKADAGYYSETNVAACERKILTPYTNIGRERHAGGLERFYLRRAPRTRAASDCGGIAPGRSALPLHSPPNFLIA